ncbi:TetR/AcrR family transcriptional regulator [Nocardia implantans]|uniref:TetR/AcrR family transcriptional regulator n=1 Tax=Nocardia implantans TaxID=3108168 RepID=A0ABU6AZR2_9NOCA|nr:MULTISPECIES: TetR/AcrR family transcriptional regulator [unclassified Nocardia]MBF6194147.1 TetR/AcrR family transcriptional regulator [Nocardia beijingensis]MEA3529755.1 TetR/AcrR family transcriptional regulator [Nocardia sp. CDC192]MEB3512767.1 TetR/AcrR family transcriptional regulator [Nocardia sp. CDC186]
MRTHGWSGTAPADDTEAVDRIVAAARAAIERSGDFTMTEIARDLGVTRQTVYRYFANADALLTATALAETGRFLDVLAAHLDHLTDPAEAVVEGIAYTLESLATDRYLGLLLTPGRAGAFSPGVTSDTALSFGRAILERFAVDWAAAGIDDARLGELVEHMLRIVQSFVIDPGRPPRTGAALRAYLTTWIAPALRTDTAPAQPASSRRT